MHEVYWLEYKPPALLREEEGLEEEARVKTLKDAHMQRMAGNQTRRCVTIHRPPLQVKKHMHACAGNS
jgi:hypothetical protein